MDSLSHLAPLLLSISPFWGFFEKGFLQAPGGGLHSLWVRGLASIDTWLDGWFGKVHLLLLESNLTAHDKVFNITVGSMVRTCD